MEQIIRMDQIAGFGEFLRREERSEKTISKYLHDVRRFMEWLDGRSVSKELVTQWKNMLFQLGRAPVTINAALAALHSFFEFAGWSDCRVKYLKIQRRVFRDSARDLSREEFRELVAAANRKGNTRLAMIMETICATGIRVSEVKYITVEAVTRGRTDISLKGKIRTILIPGKLARKLQKFAKKRKITSGEIFLTVRGNGVSRRQIWKEMKEICGSAGVDESKVFPHNLRHLFARVFYQAWKDIVRLADVLGHCSIETTRIYLVTTGAEHAKQLDALKLVS